MTSARPAEKGSLDILANTSSAVVFALVLVAASRDLAHAVLAEKLLQYSLAAVAAWLFTLGAPTRFVSFATAKTTSFTRAIWQTSLTALVLVAVAAICVWSMPTGPIVERLRSLMIVIPPVLAAYIGREVSNVAYGRRRTSLQCLLQTTCAAAIAAVMHFYAGWTSSAAFSAFLLVHYAAGSLQLIAYLGSHGPNRVDLSLAYIRHSGRTNMALGLGTMLLGNFDKLALSFRQVLNSADSAYLIADRLVSAYGTVMTYYTQSRVQRAIAGKDWTSRSPTSLIDTWFLRSSASAALFTLVASGAMALGGPLLKVAIQPLTTAAFVLAICATLHLKNCAGYAIRILDSLQQHDRFNAIAGGLIAVGLASLYFVHQSNAGIIVAAKLVLHALMLWALRRCARGIGDNT